MFVGGGGGGGSVGVVSDSDTVLPKVERETNVVVLPGGGTGSSKVVAGTLSLISHRSPESNGVAVVIQSGHIELWMESSSCDEASSGCKAARCSVNDWFVCGAETCKGERESRTRAVSATVLTA